MTMTVGLWVTLETKAGRADDVAAFLTEGANLVQQEPLTLTWFAVRLGETTFAIFDTFATDDGRQAHLSGAVAQALGSIADTLLAAPPRIQPVDLLASIVR
jgi:quinol monooxygenase YgiN